MYIGKKVEFVVKQYYLVSVAQAHAALVSIANVAAKLMVGSNAKKPLLKSNSTVTHFGSFAL